MQISVTLNGDLKNDLSNFLKGLSEEIIKDAKANTPIRSGNARRSWTKTTTKSGAVINNKVPYIERLEAGASRQAPRGILGPTLTQVKGKYK